MEVKTRQMIERRIVSRLIYAGLRAGYTISVNNGEEHVLKKSTNRKDILAAMFSVDEEHLHFYKDDKHVGWVFLVYGNDGWDVICDYNSSLEPIMDSVDKVSDKLATLYG